MLSYPALSEHKSYKEVADSVHVAKAELGRLEIKVSPGSVLHRIFQDAIKASAIWDTGGEKLEIGMVLNLLYSDVICSAIANANTDPNVKIPLRRIAGSDITRLSRDASQGKDALWELTLLSILKKASISASLNEPDIVADFDFGKYSIACKKVYSEGNVEKQLRAGVRQVTDSGNKGIVAFNLDELTPGDSMLSLANSKVSMKRLSSFNEDFILRNSDLFRRYMDSKRIDGVLVATSVPADILTDARRLSNVTQHTFFGPARERDGYKRLNELVGKLSLRAVL